MKRQVTYWLFALALFFLPSPWGEGPGMRAFAQTVTPTFIGSTGGSGTVTPTMHISYSVGEAVISTFTIGSGTVRTITQGFQQPEQACPTVTSLTVAPSTTVCAGTNVSISPIMTGNTGVEAYVWSSGQTTSSIVVAPTINTVYTFSVVGCSSTIKSTTVTVNSTPTVSVSPVSSTICSGSSATLTASGASTYLWSTGETTATINPSPGSLTSYTVTGTDASTCTNTASASVDVEVPPLVTPTSVNPTDICAGDFATLTAKISAGVTYVWNPGGLTGAPISVSPTSTTNYTLTATSASGACVIVDAATTLTVTPIPATPTATATPTPLCEGGNLTLTASGGAGTYQWDGPNSYFSNAQNPPSFTVAITGAGTYSVTETVNGCVSLPGIVSVTVDAPPSPADAGTNQTLCGTAPAGTNLAATAPTSGSGAWFPLGPATVLTPSSPTSAVTGLIAGDNVFQWTVSNGACTPSVATVTITLNAAPVVSIAQTPATCAGTCNGDATMSVTTGTSPYTYLWSGGGQTTSTATNLCAGPYTCTVTDAMGCTASASVTVTEPIALSNVISTTSVTCSGGNNGTATATLTGGTTPYTYSWSNGQSTSTATGLSFGTYSVAVTDANGCSTQKNFNIVEPNPIILNTTVGGTSCASNCDGMAGVTASGGTGTFTYAWGTSPAQSTASATGLCAQSYSVLVTDNNGCTASAFVPINPGPALSASVTATQTLVCAGSPVTLTASGGTTYIWNPGNISGAIITVNPTVQTTYTASVSIGSCTKDTTITINVSPSPTVSITGTPASLAICEGDAITLTAFAGAGTYSYNWSNGGPNPNTVNPTTNTTYSVTVTDLNSLCASSALVTVTVTATPTVSISGTSTICSGSTATIGASGGSTYSWSTGATTAVINPVLTSSQGFTVTATNGGCSDTASFFVSVTTTPSASVTATPASVCAGGTSTLSASGGTTYLWTPGGATSSTIVTPPLTSPANYTVTVSNGACSDTALITVGVSTISANISITNNDSTLCEGETTVLTASSGNSYVWTPGGATSPGISISPTNTTMYYVTITSGACSGTDSILVTVVPTPTAAITASADTVCLLQGVTLTASGGTSYQWDGGPATAVYNATPTALGNNTYSVTVSNGSCSSGTTYVIFAKGLPAVTALANPPGGICAGDTAILSASGAATYTWSIGAFTSSVPVWPLVNTTYTVVGTDATGCSNFSTVTVVLNSITVDAGVDVTICPGFTADLNAVITGNTSGVTYNWSPAQFMNDPTVPNPSVTPDTSTMFLVYVTNGSCTATDSVMVNTARTPACVIHVYNGITPNGDNDNNSWFIDGIQSYPENKVFIFNRWGTKIWGAEGYNNKDILWKGTNQQGDILPAGTYYYFIELYDGDGGTIFTESSWVEVTH